MLFRSRLVQAGERPAPGSALPQRLGRLRLDETWSRRCLHGLAWLYTTAGRCLRARWTLLCHPRTGPWWGVWIALMGVVIFLPLPFGNVLPSISLVLLSLGWMFRDGLALLASAVVGSGAGDSRGCVGTCGRTSRGGLAMPRRPRIQPRRATS